MMPETYRNGYNAYVHWNLNGGGMPFNPYKITDDRDDWDTGWNDAKTDHLYFDLGQK